MSHALVNLSIRPDDLAKAANRIHAAYAKKYQMDHYIITEEQFRIRPNLLRKRRVGIHLEKFQIHDLFDRYNKILYLDSDTIIHQSCPNMFEWIELSSLACFFETDPDDEWKRSAELERMERRLGRLPSGERRYFNAGVLVVDKQARELFRMKRDEIVPGRWPDQTLLNYRTHRMGLSVKPLEATYNFLPNQPGWHKLETRRQAMIIHYAGVGAKDYMSMDIGWALDSWGISV